MKGIEYKKHIFSCRCRIFYTPLSSVTVTLNNICTFAHLVIFCKNNEVQICIVDLLKCNDLFADTIVIISKITF